MGKVMTGSDGEGPQERHGLFGRRKNRNASFFQPHQILVPSGFHPGEPQGDGLARLRGLEKDSHEFLGELKGRRVNLNGQRIDIGLCNHRVEDGRIDAPRIVKLNREAEVPGVGRDVPGGKDRSQLIQRGAACLCESQAFLFEEVRDDHALPAGERGDEHPVAFQG